jgi:hypothetical protein
LPARPQSQECARNTKDRFDMADNGTDDEARRAAALVNVARLVAAGSLTLGSVLLTIFGLVERIVGFGPLAHDPRFAVFALMPAGAALAFLASARTIGAMYDTAVPPRPISDTARVIRRFREFSSGYGFFAIIISGLVGVSTALAVSLLLPGVDRLAIVSAIIAGFIGFPVAFFGMLTRESPLRRFADYAFVLMLALVTLIAVLT